METFTNVTTASFDFDDEAFESVSEEAKNFIGALLVRKKEDRPSARECLESKWLSDINENFSNTRICTTKLKKFIIRRKWQVRLFSDFFNIPMSFFYYKSNYLIRLII